MSTQILNSPPSKIAKTLHQWQTSYIHPFSVYLQLERGLSANTLDAYLRDTEKLLGFFAEEGIEPASASIDDLQRFSAALYDIGLEARSHARRLSGVRAFYK